MRRLLALTLTIAMAVAAMGQNHFELGNQAYDSADYAAAAEQYELHLANHPSAAAYYNLGNAHYRQGNLGQAIVNYERAHRLAPLDRETAENLAFCYAKTEDHIEPLPQLFALRWWRGITGLMTPHGWMWFSLLLLALACGGLCIFLLSRSYPWRKGSLIATSALGLLLLLSAMHTFAPRPCEAIVTAPMAVVKSSPDPQSTDLFILHEGTKVTVDDEVQPWKKIHIADGQKGWIQLEAIEII